MKIEHIALYVNDLEKMRTFMKPTFRRSATQNTIIRKQAFSPIF